MKNIITAIISLILLSFYCEASAAPERKVHPEINQRIEHQEHREEFHYEHERHRYHPRFEYQPYSWVLDRYFYEYEITDVVQFERPGIYQIIIPRWEFNERQFAIENTYTDGVCSPWNNISDMYHQDSWARVCAYNY